MIESYSGFGVMELPRAGCDGELPRAGCYGEPLQMRAGC